MEKMRMESVDMTEKNIEKIESLFPNCITEALDENGKLKKAINFELLKQILSDEIVDGDEAYEFTWVGKKAAIVEANKPIRKTLRPCIEESVDWDNTENLYIEGDNLEVLKLLQESYLDKVKMIYIDPPYNTGNDFIYNDDFKLKNDDYSEVLGEYDELGNRLFKNTDTNGRFHSDWCSMFYSRLMLSRNLLRDDGAIFVSIDDHENDNTKKILNEVFGENNFIACVVWQRNYAPISLKKFFSESHEYCYVYAKNKDSFAMNLLPRSEKQNKDYKNPDNDPRGVWKVGNLTVGPAVDKQIYEIIGPTGKKFLPPSGYCWRFTKDRFEQMRLDNRIWFGADGNNAPVPKLFLTEVQDGVTPMTLWTFDEAGHNQIATRELRDLFGGAVFTSPKPTKYINRYLQIGMGKDDIILDFFSGSATTAHSTMLLNSIDGGKRKFILVQVPENCDSNSIAYNLGYKTICDIGKNRIKKVAERLKKDYDNNIDLGFRVFRLDNSNMTDVYYSADEYSQNLLSNLESNIKSDRNELDLLFGCLIEWGLPLSLPYNSEKIEGCTVHNYNNGDLVACFNENIPDSVIKYIAKKQPLRAVFRDGSFASSPAKINVGEIFKSLAPDTRVKVI